MFSHYNEWVPSKGTYLYILIRELIYQALPVMDTQKSLLYDRDILGKYSYFVTISL